MCWVSDYKYRWYEKLAMNVVKSGGHLPKHIAFIMDGNRRYAKSERIATIDGHTRGFDKLSNCLRWCLDIGVREVTTFAFSIENFKRNEEEVNDLLNLARDKFNELLKELPKLHEYGVRVRIIGNISLLPKDLQSLIAKAMIKTECNDKLYLNIAFSYTSRDEITQAIEVILTQGNDLQLEDITEYLIEECFYSRQSSPPDLLFRTSGETRISDFLMWQLTFTILYFTKILWPQISIWNFLAGIIYYQRASRRMNAYKNRECIKRLQLMKNSSLYTTKIQDFLHRLDMYRKNILLKLIESK